MSMASRAGFHGRGRPDRAALHASKVSTHYRLTERRMRPRPRLIAFLIVGSIGP